MYVELLGLLVADTHNNVHRAAAGGVLCREVEF
jgi:hypothetical protein